MFETPWLVSQLPKMERSFLLKDEQHTNNTVQFSSSDLVCRASALWSCVLEVPVNLEGRVWLLWPGRCRHDLGEAPGLLTLGV